MVEELQGNSLRSGGPDFQLDGIVFVVSPVAPAGLIVIMKETPSFPG